MDRFCTTHTLINNMDVQVYPTFRTEEAVTAVERSIEDDTNESIRHHAQKLELCSSTFWGFFGKILVFELYLSA